MIPTALTLAQEISIQAGTVIAVEYKSKPPGSNERTFFKLYEVSRDFHLSVYGETFVERNVDLLASFEAAAMRLERDRSVREMEIYPTKAKQLNVDGQDIGATAGAVYIMQGQWAAVGGEMPKFKINQNGCYRVQPTEKQLFQCLVGPAWERKKANVVEVAAGSIIAMEVRISEGRIYKTVWNLYEVSDDFQMSTPSKGKVVRDSDRLDSLRRLTNRLSPIVHQERGSSKELLPIKAMIRNSQGDDVGMTAGAIYVIEGGWQPAGATTKFKVFEDGCQRFELDKKQAFKFSRGITWNGEKP